MIDYDLIIEYTETASEGIKEKVIAVDLDKYRESYEEDYFHLQQQYSEAEAQRQIKPNKEEFLNDIIRENLSANEKPHIKINSLIDEIDDYIKEYSDEFEADDEDNYDNYDAYDEEDDIDDYDD